MATNDFLPYAVGGGANVLSQSAYAALTSLLANGLSSGIVPSNQLNKTLRQPTIMAAVIGQLIADVTGQNAVDDGTIATLEANLARVIRGGASYATDTGSANAYAITLSPVPAALVAGMGVSFIAGNANTGASTLSVNGTSKNLTKNGSIALAPGDIPAGAVVTAQYDGTRWQMGGAAGTGNLINVQTFTSSGTYTPTAGTNSVIVEVQGGGGQGAGTPSTSSGQANAGPGGSGGAYGKGRITSGFSGAAVTVGAGGSGAAAGTSGNNGATSSFGAFISAPGGFGGQFFASVSTFPTIHKGTTGGFQASGGSLINSTGFNGSLSIIQDATTALSGDGGSSVFGSGGVGVSGSASAGTAGVTKGSGGSGASAPQSSAAQAGGAGAPGVVIVYEYS